MQASMTEIIHHPGPDDVLCGRGGATNNHQGNRRFRDLVHAHQAEYLAAKKRDKRVIARAIVSIILRERGGRFLKKVGDVAYGGGGGGSEDLWYDVGEKKATEKTSQALREGLDARSLAAKGIRVPVHVQAQHRRRAVPPSTESSSSDEQHEPPRKRRRTNGHGPASPALVSEIDRNNKIAPADGFSLGYGGNDDQAAAMAAMYPPNDTVEVAYLADAPPPSAEDVGEIVAL